MIGLAKANVTGVQQEGEGVGRKGVGEVAPPHVHTAPWSYVGRNWDPSIHSTTVRECQVCPCSRAHGGGRSKAPAPAQLTAREETDKGHVSTSCNLGLKKSCEKNGAERGWSGKALLER